MLRDALSSKDPLFAIREAIDEHNEAQKTVVWAFGAILDTSSAGFPILLDRFDDSELTLIEGALDAIDASKSLETLRRLRSGAPSKGEAPSRAELVDEMEARLLTFCETNLDKLASVREPESQKPRGRAQ